MEDQPMRPIIVLLMASVVLASCGREPVDIPEPRERTIEPYRVVEAAGSRDVRLPGLIQAADRASLAFAVSGTLVELNVNNSDRVEEGAIIARLDDELFRLQIDTARAQLQRASATAEERRLELDRRRQLYESGWISPAALEQFTAAYVTAESDVRASRALLGQMTRALERSILYAPYAGVIANVYVDPFEEVHVGMPIAELNADGGLEVLVDAPDRLAGQLIPGMSVSVDLATVQGCGCAGQIVQVGRDAGATNTIPVTVSIRNPPANLLPGMAASATITLVSETIGTPIPFASVVAGPTQDQVHVFLYDRDTSRVQLVPITVTGAQGNIVLVSEGLSEGDIIAAAGAGILRDGQRVRLPEDFQ
ncbi:MAG: efflux RND transporter periplasmic adaptor subunit [Alphaproteobacteria bacterium]|nr:efflux RND transporter periplasmic adaptor subunit [Alphaproteobacteria bacterium]